MNSSNHRPPAPKYQDSTMSDKAFKHMIFWFSLFVVLFCLGVFFAVGADMSNYS